MFQAKLDAIGYIIKLEVQLALYIPLFIMETNLDAIHGLFITSAGVGRQKVGCVIDILPLMGILFMGAFD